MKKCFKTIAMAVCVVFLAGSVWAANPFDHVKVAPNGKGDVLLYPFYAAIQGGWETKLTVVNTSDTYSTVAKVIVRSPVFTEEILDFFIYLSPTDVWTGTLKYDANQGAMLESDDDSIIARLGAENVPVWGDEEVATRALVVPEGVGDFNEMGYLYVINVASFTGTVLGRDLGTPPVNKRYIYDAYRSLPPLGTVPAEYQPQNILAGWMDFQVAGFGLTSSLDALTLRDYKNNLVAAIAEEYQLGDGNANNNLFEIEAVLAKQDIAMPYLNTGDDISVHFLTFPTKYSEYDSDLERVVGVRGPFAGFNPDRGFCVRFSLNLYDTTEDSLTPDDPIWSPAPPPEFNDLCNELNWLVSSDSPFDEGWIRYNFNYTTTGTDLENNPMSYTGAPVIPVSLNLGSSGMSLKYGAWTDGTVMASVENTNIVLPYYQYSDLDWLMNVE